MVLLALHSESGPKPSTHRRTVAREARRAFRRTDSDCRASLLLVEPRNVLPAGASRGSRVRLLRRRRRRARRRSSTRNGTSRPTSSSPRSTAFGSRTSSRRTTTPTTSPARGGWRRRPERPSTSLRRPASSSSTSRSPTATRSRSARSPSRRSRHPGTGPSTRPTSSPTGAGARSPGSSSPATRSSWATSRGPDLAVDPEEGARGLFASLKRLLALGDFAEVWPGHIGGSLCGGAGMSEKPVTTIGFERRFNRLLARDDEDGFVRALTGNLAHQPPNFKRIVALNRGPLLTEPQPLDLLAPAAVKDAARRRRDPARRAGHARVRRRARPGLHQRDHGQGGRGDAGRLGRGRRERGGRRGRERRGGAPDGATAGGRRLPADRGRAGRRRRRLARRGLSGRVDGCDRHPGARRAAQARRRAPPRRPRRGRMGRGPRRRLAPRPYHDLRDGLPDELRNGGTPLAVACSAGNRSSIAVSLLRRAGFDDVIHVADGGIAELPEEGIELVRGRP